MVFILSFILQHIMFDYSLLAVLCCMFYFFFKIPLGFSALCFQWQKLQCTIKTTKKQFEIRLLTKYQCSQFSLFSFILILEAIVSFLLYTRSTTNLLQKKNKNGWEYHSRGGIFANAPSLSALLMKVMIIFQLM